jgi:hypothetical protein
MLPKKEKQKTRPLIRREAGRVFQRKKKPGQSVSDYSLFRFTPAI